MRVFASTAGNPTELKPRKIHVPSSELLFAEGAVEHGKEKTAYLLCPAKIMVLPEKVASSGINQSSFRGCCEIRLG